MYSAIASNKRRSIMIMFLFVVLIAGLSWALSVYFGNNNYLIFGIVYAVIYTLISYKTADKIALATSGAKEIQKSDNPRLWRIVENLSITTGQPMPRVYIINDPAINAFATGRRPEASHIAFTAGSLGLEDNELEAVAAHELGHIKNYDIRLMMVVLACVTAISIVSQFALRMMWWGDDNDGNNASPIMMIAGVVLIILIPIVGTFVQFAISRRRELLADATSAMTTRYPEGLISALRKIGAQGSALKHGSPATAHMYFSNPIKQGLFSRLMSTHPPIEERIAKLEAMETKL